jgi:hypothetical protein
VTYLFDYFDYNLFRIKLVNALRPRWRMKSKICWKDFLWLIPACVMLWRRTKCPSCVKDTSPVSTLRPQQQSRGVRLLWNQERWLADHKKSAHPCMSAHDQAKTLTYMKWAISQCARGAHRSFCSLGAHHKDFTHFIDYFIATSSSFQPPTTSLLFARPTEALPHDYRHTVVLIGAIQVWDSLPKSIDIHLMHQSAVGSWRHSPWVSNNDRF